MDHRRAKDKGEGKEHVFEVGGRVKGRGVEGDKWWIGTVVRRGRSGKCGVRVLGSAPEIQRRIFDFHEVEHPLLSRSAVTRSTSRSAVTPSPGAR